MEDIDVIEYSLDVFRPKPKAVERNDGRAISSLSIPINFITLIVVQFNQYNYVKAVVSLLDDSKANATASR